MKHRLWTMGLVGLAIVLLASACRESDAGTTTTTTSSPTAEPPTTAEDAGLKWWNDRVFYEIFVRSFQDSDGDGIGDFPGLTASLDYLNDGDPSTTNDLGITGIWLMPIFPSPSYHGYDVVDYRNINPDYGTLEDFDVFLDAAHQRGIAVIIDLVINHTGVDHPWFQASRAGDPEYADWYLWSDTDPATTGPWGQQVWHQADGRHYFGLFWRGMPDLNLDLPAVTAELRDIARFWLEDVGVDGFRLDAARHLIEEDTVMSDTPATVDWLAGFNRYVDGVAPQALVLGEVWSSTNRVAEYVGDALDLAFEFDLAAAGAAAVDGADAGLLVAAQEEARDAYPPGQYAVFLTNHDMDRIMSVFQGNVDMAKLAASWLLTSPGVPFVYYGEEVGLQGTKPDERIRTPMPWNQEAPGVGFTEGTPWERADPSYERFNVAAADADPGSLLNHYRSLIQFRNTSPALRFGSVTEVETGRGDIFAYLRSLGDDHVLVVGNLAPTPVSGYALDLPMGPLAGMRGVEAVVGPGAVAPAITADGGFLAYRPVDPIPAYGALVLHFTTETTPLPPPPTTTTTTTIAVVDATEADAAVAQAFWEPFVGGDPDGWVGLLAPDAQVVEGDEQFGVSDPVPPGLSIPDWDGNGVVAVLDVIYQQSAFARITRNQVSVACVPAGPEVACTVNETDMFYDAAGTAPPPVVQRLTIEDGLIAEIGVVDVADFEAADAAFGSWVSHYGLFEAWVNDTYPDRFDSLFTAPCCVGSPGTLNVVPATVDELGVLLDEWSAGIG